jgi:hypothetical protein
VNGGNELGTTLLVLATLAVLGWGYVQLHKKAHAKFWQLLAETNDRHGTSFGTSLRIPANVTAHSGPT